MSTDQGNDGIASLLVDNNLRRCVKRVVAEEVTDGGNKDSRHSNQTKELLKNPKRKLASPKSVKPWWQTALSVIVKNCLLILFLAGMIRIVWNLVISISGSDGSVNLIELKGEILSLRSEMDNRFEKKGEEIASRLNILDEKHQFLEKALGQLNSKDFYAEFSKSKIGESGQIDLSLDEIRALARQGEEIASRLNILDAKYQLLEKALGQLNSKDLLSKKDFAALYEEFSKSKIGDSGQIDLSLDKIRALARQIVEQEIEKHAADGLGRVDYALATGDATVLAHSKPFERYPYRIGFRSDPNKMLRPSFGDPGECYALEGSSGFAVVKLRAAIIPEAVTLEHVAKSVANDRSNAPRDCRVFGWLRGVDDGGETLLAEFTYDLDKSNAQTYNVLDSANSTVVNTIRFEFTSNHGSPSHTCIYRIRVHGHEPNLISPVSSALNEPILPVRLSVFSLLCTLCIFF